MKLRFKYSFGRNSVSRKKTVSRYLQMTADKAIISSPIDFGVPWMGGRREAEEQNDLFKKKYSKADGYKNLSFHQQTDKDGLGMAIDLVPYLPEIGFAYDATGRFGIIGMLMLEAWEELQDDGEIPKGIYLHWGGFWRNRNPKDLGWDLAHYEIRTVEQVERL